MNNILIALLVISLLGLLASLLLSLASYFMSVKENEKVKKLRECLPGINCGACGYRGCDDYANALSDDGVKTNLCVPGADAVARELAEILGVDAEDVIEKIAIVHCNGTCDAVNEINAYAGVDSCLAKSQLYGGPLACKYGCLGSGDCADVCPNDAICTKDGVARIDKRKCVGCGLCVTVCPKGLISLVPAVSKTAVLCLNKDKGAVARKDCTNACIGCKKCENNCPKNAIAVIDNVAIIDYQNCSGCGICVKECPTHAIKEI